MQQPTEKPLKVYTPFDEQHFSLYGEEDMELDQASEDTLRCFHICLRHNAPMYT